MNFEQYNYCLRVKAKYFYEQRKNLKKHHNVNVEQHTAQVKSSYQQRQDLTSIENNFVFIQS